MSVPRRGFAFGDALLLLGGLAVAASLAYPPLAHRAYQKHVDGVLTGVEALRTAALEYRNSRGSWPDEAPAGTVSGDLAPLLPGDMTLQAGDFAMGWTLWKVVETPPQPLVPTVAPDAPLPRGGRPAPPATADSLGTRPPVVRELGGIIVNTSEDGLLAALLDRYGSTRSFVRDSTWTLVLGPDTVF